MDILLSIIQAGLLNSYEAARAKEQMEMMMPIFIIIIGAVLLGIIISCIIIVKVRSKRNKKVYGDNSNEKIMTVDAMAISKRIETTDKYIGEVKYITFQFTNGARKEFAIRDSNKFGMIVERDVGVLQYRGNQFLEFTRKY